MRKLQRFAIAVVLTLMLAVSAFAGDILTPSPSPNSASAVAAGKTQIAGDILTGGNAPSTQSDSITEIALTLLLSAFSAF